MARIRSIKPEFFTSPSTAKLSPRARLLFIAMWCWADDYGKGETNLNGLLGLAFPESDDLERKDVQSLASEVQSACNVVFYVVEERPYFAIPSWDRHQKTQRRAESRIPDPDDPRAVPDPRFHAEVAPVAEMHGASESTQGGTPSGTGEQGNRGTGEQGSLAESDDSDDDAQIPDPNDRDDVRELLDHLDAKIHEVDPEAKLPNRTKANADAARLLLDKDHRSIDQVKAAIDWALNDEFWRPNIRSMSKLRAKYDTLRGQAQRTRSTQPTAAERQHQISAERHERITQGQFGPRPEIENDPALWMPRQIEET